MKSKVMTLIPLLFATAILEIVSYFDIVPQYLLPAPTTVLYALWEDLSNMLHATGETGFAAFSGLLLSIIAGIAAGVLLSFTPKLEQIFYPYAVFFQTVPIIALAPILVIWFGYGMPTVIVSAFIVSVFPMIANTLTGLKAVDPKLLELFSLYKAKKNQVFFNLRFPFALNHILTGVRISGGLAVIGAIVGEFVGGGGLGEVIDTSRMQQRLDRVFAAVLLAALVGLLFFLATSALHRYFLRRWRLSA